MYKKPLPLGKSIHHLNGENKTKCNSSKRYNMFFFNGNISRPFTYNILRSQTTGLSMNKNKTKKVEGSIDMRNQNSVVLRCPNYLEIEEAIL